MKITILTLLCVLPLSVFAQTLTVKGTVIDKYDRDPLPFVGIYVNRNTDTVVYPDENGRYSIQVNLGDLLIFSSIGYNSFEATVDGRLVIDVEMDCEDCGRYYHTEGMRKQSHDISVMSAYDYSKWGFAASYAYLPKIYRPQNIFNILLKNAHPSIRVQNLASAGSDLRLYPYLKIPIPISIPLFTRKQKLYTFATAGYYFDTDFKRVQRHDWGIGGGITTRLARFDFGGWYRYISINLTAGYNAFIGSEKKHNVYLGLRFHIFSAFIYE